MPRVVTALAPRARLSRGWLAPLGLLLLTAPGAARADEDASPPSTAAAPSANEPAAPELVWRDDWARFRPAEYVLVPVLGAAMLTTGLATPGKTNPTWLGRNGFDDAARRAFAGRSSTTRKAASTASDILYVSLTLYPAAIEALVLAGIVHKSKDVAFQLFMIYGEAALTSGLVSVAAQGLAYRGRPLVLGCRQDGGYDAICGTKQESRSFFAGHVSMSFNTAALTCVNQAHLPLYGSRGGGIAACATTLTAATATGFFRLVGDKHWATDVLTGAGVGTATGLLYPLLLHYGFGHGPMDAHVGGGTLAVTPVVAGNTTGVAVGWTQ
ncbi:MAG: hypothetical protein JWP97_6053 [Labilithrix sp.]|nr:hypothetical protein [Labilithrix sp.]